MNDNDNDPFFDPMNRGAEAENEAARSAANHGVGAVGALRESLGRRRRKGTTIGTPFGRRVLAEEFLGLIQFDMQNNPWMNRPDLLMKEEFLATHPVCPCITNPRFMGRHSGWHFAWPNKKNPRFAALARADKYLIVDANDLKEHHEGEVTTHQGAEGSYVMWYDHILVAISARHYEELFAAPQMLGSYKLALAEEGFQSDVERTARAYDVEVETEVKSPF